MVNKRVLVVDLDGTLYSINTFHYFLKFLIFYCIKTFRIVLLIKIAGIIALRIFKMTTHAKMKYDILRTIFNQTQMDCSKFVDSIREFKRDLKFKKSEFDITILATAAPSCYANIIAKNEDFDWCTATNNPDSSFNDEFENIKEVKRNNVLNFLIQNDIDKIDTLVTDHIDDLPLMKISITNRVVNPDTKFKTELKRHQISYEIICGQNSMK